MVAYLNFGYGDTRTIITREERRKIRGFVDYPGPVILAVDPGFKKCGFAIISKDKGEYIESF